MYKIVTIAFTVCLSVAACGPDEATKQATRACEHLSELAKTTGTVDARAANSGQTIEECVGMLKALRETVSQTAWKNIVGCIDESTTHAATAACIATPTAESPNRK